MKLLVINTGSSSIKYKLFDMEEKRVLSAGLVERIGEEKGRIKHQRFYDDKEPQVKEEELSIQDHRVGLEQISELLQDEKFGAIRHPEEIRAVGHRVVHGGSRFSEAVVINTEVKDAIQSLVPLAPLHNPPNLEGIAVAEEVFAHAQQVAVFDTAFHQSMPDYAYHYAIPQKYYQEHQIRVYGMHGTSHQYVAHQAAKHLGVPGNQLNAITIHLGNGCSMTAVKEGKSIDTSMGLSPLPGLIMGTRSGDIDPAIIFYMGTKLNMSFEDIDQVLNKQSGLKGIAGENDVRTVVERYEQGDRAAVLALEMYAYRIRKYIGAYLAVTGRLHALIFTAGVGENSSLIREKACEGLEHLGIRMNPGKNLQKQKGIQEIQDEKSQVRILVVPTDEELSIAEQAYGLVKDE